MFASFVWGWLDHLWTPPDFLLLAQQLAQATTEAAWRTAVSRAYYAAFHVARQLLEDLGFRVPQADRAHAYLWLRLCNCGDPQVERAGMKLNDLRRERNTADYYLGMAFRQTPAQRQPGNAASIIQVLESAALEPTRSAITDAMKIYERDVLKDVTWHP
jgi:uncharacterized protein (UPF0332 family)